MQRKNEVTIVFWFFHKPKTSFFQKHSKSARQTHFFQKMTKIFYLMVDFFNKFYELEMKICAIEARRLKSKIEFRRLMEKMKKRFWTSWRSTKSTDIWRSGGGFGKKNLQGWERRSSGKFTILLVFLRKRRRWAFSLNKYASGLGSTNLSRILRFNFSYETDFWANSFVAQKSSEMSPLSGSSPVFVSQPLAAQTF